MEHKHLQRQLVSHIHLSSSEHHWKQRQQCCQSSLACKQLRGLCVCVCTCVRTYAIGTTPDHVYAGFNRQPREGKQGTDSPKTTNNTHTIHTHAHKHTHTRKHTQAPHLSIHGFESLQREQWRGQDVEEQAGTYTWYACLCLCKCVIMYV